ncbi:MAG: phosphoenolpyruvate synthase [Clostridia bacterium]|nr:phosphoenolpyruvate synthase [Clostridia bacterium]
MSDYIIRHDYIDESSFKKLGGKAGSLARLSEYDLPIPEWFAVTNNAFFDSLTKEQADLLNAGKINDFTKSIENLEVRKDIADRILKEIKTISGDAFAVRSSALSEDSGSSSFAGQFETYLWTPVENLLEKTILVWKSAFAERVLFYREQNGVTGIPEVPTVLIQKMVKAEKAGVAFGINPITASEKTATVSAVFGLGSALVDGDANADVYTVDLDGNTQLKQIADKNVSHVIKNNSVVCEDVPEELKKVAVLTDEQVKEVAELARRTGGIFGRYQDIEWAYEDDNLYLLQSRPITTIGTTVQTDARTVIFDNSNIAESYGNVTMPLTASFIAYVYQEVYKQFCALFGISQKVIDENSLMFKCMLGFKDGRVYYNLLSWYQMLAIMPYYEAMSSLMESMMGVKEPLPKEFMDSVKPKEESKFLKTRKNIRTINHFLHTYNHLDSKVEKFYGYTKEALDDRRLDEMSIDELYSYYYELESKLISKWDTPLANDFFTMIFHGTLSKLCGKWCTDKDIHNDLLCGQGGIISAEPARLTREMAASIRDDHDFCVLLTNGSLSQITNALKKKPEFKKQLSAYMERFSDRCMDELKLESDTLSDNPLLLYRSIGALSLKSQFTGEDREETVRVAELKVKQDLKGHPIRKIIFKFIRKNAGKTVRNRENLRFERTRVFGRVRRIVVELGIRFSSRGVIEDKRDIFFLEIGEIMGYIDGTSSTYDLKGLVKLRKNEYEENRKKSTPPRRFVVHGTMGGAPMEEFKFQNNPQADTENSGNAMKGLACCPGLITGVARVVVDPTNTAMRDGEILVAERTDPGWITLFSMASALVVERGSLLSHAAIVSREMGIPAVVSVDDATTLIKDGDIIRVNGMTGTVEILETKNNEIGE